MSSPMDKLGESLERFSRLERGLKRGRRPRRRWTRLVLTTVLAALCVTVALPPFRYPVGGRVSSRFFLRRSPDSPSPVALEMHHGLDIAAQAGSPVLASAPGVVTEVGYNEVVGTYVRMRHLLGFSTLYGHLSAVTTRLGAVVLLRSVNPIGRVGSTGRSTGPHVHFELSLGGTRIPPAAFLIWHDLRRLIIRR